MRISIRGDLQFLERIVREHIAIDDGNGPRAEQWQGPEYSSRRLQRPRLLLAVADGDPIAGPVPEIGADLAAQPR